jgi:phage regulator Rha-like protein
MNLSLIQTKIFDIRNQKVILDVDLALLYEVQTKVLNQAVKRNIERFPSDFMFQLNRKEFENLKSQFVTSSTNNKASNLGGRRKLPFAFSEHGVTMLASVLRSERAIKMNISIVRAFISLRNMAKQQIDITEQLNLIKEVLNQRIDEHDVQLKAIYDTIENLLDQKMEEKDWENRNRIRFKKF